MRLPTAGMRCCATVFDAHENLTRAVKVTIEAECGAVPTLAVEVEHPVLRREP